MKNKNEVELFEEQQIRSVWNEEDENWYFVVSDVVRVLTGTADTKDYLKKMRRRDRSLAEGWGQLVTPLPIKTAGGWQSPNRANAQGLLRIIQSIPSLKAEPFKRWLAQVGSERLNEMRKKKALKGRKKENLRDNMTSTELILNLLVEASTTDI